MLLGALFLIDSSIPILNLFKYFLSQELYNLLPSLPQLWAQSWLKHSIPQKLFLKAQAWGFPGGSVVKNLPANAGDTGLIPGLGRSHLLRSNWEAQLLSLRATTTKANVPRACALQQESSPSSLGPAYLEQAWKSKAGGQEWLRQFYSNSV